MLALSENALAPLIATLVAAAQDPSPTSTGGLKDLLPIFFALAVFFYLIVLRPQKKERQQRQGMLDSMKKGDRVVSIGGVHGKITDLDEVKKTVTVDVGSKVTLKFSRTAIQTVEPKESGKKPAKDDKEKK